MFLLYVTYIRKEIYVYLKFRLDNDLKTLFFLEYEKTLITRREGK